MVRARGSHPVFARFYQFAGPLMELGGMAGHRRDLLAGLSGEVIEIGAGTGLNFPFYPPAVTRVTAVEPEPLLRADAARAATQARVRIDVVDGRAEQLGSGDGSFDAAVTCLVLCSVTDQRAAAAEIRRVVRPGGQLRFFEHVSAGTPLMRPVQRLLDASVWPALFGGCHLGRDTLGTITAAGFEVGCLDQVRYPDLRLVPPFIRYVRGVAHLAPAAAEGSERTMARRAADE